jgi:O-antigen/teichoic acid export membrane protein
MWMTVQAVVTKVLGTVGQIMLAHYLLRADFGIASIAYMFSIIPVLIQQGGLRDVLIRRHHHFSRWGNAAFWMSMVLGTAGGGIMALIAPIAALVKDEPRLLDLLLLIALLFPLDSLSIVPMARLQGQMRFRLLAGITLMQTVIQYGFSILLAYWGWGPYSIILPRIPMAIMTAIICWRCAPVSLRWRMQANRWKYLIGDGAQVIVANACDTMMVYMGTIVLSAMTTNAVVGVYAFASNLSIQATALITTQLGNVLFPALSTLQHDAPRQVAAFLRAVRLLACLAVPACFLQAALADPGVHLLFPEEWWDAIPILQILSIGMAMRSIGAPSLSLLQAQGRFGTRMRLALISVCVLAALMIAGALRDGARGAAIGAAIQMIITEPLALRMAISGHGRGARDVVHALAGPVLLGTVCVAPAMMLAWSFNPLTPGLLHWWRLGSTLVLAIVLFWPALRLIAPHAWRELRARVHSFLPRTVTA